MTADELYTLVAKHLQQFNLMHRKELDSLGLEGILFCVVLNNESGVSSRAGCAGKHPQYCLMAASNLLNFLLEQQCSITRFDESPNNVKPEDSMTGNPLFASTHRTKL